MEGTVIKGQMPQMSSIPSASTQPRSSDERPLTGTGAYDLSQKFENLELNDSDNYSDDDFYSDEFEDEPNNQGAGNQNNNEEY